MLKVRFQQVKCFQYSFDAISKEVLIKACAPLRTLIVCGCFVVACFRLKPVSLLLHDFFGTFPLSVMMSVIKRACLVMMSQSVCCVYCSGCLNLIMQQLILKKRPLL